MSVLKFKSGSLITNDRKTMIGLHLADRKNIRIN
jgi:hypothetical protein